MAVLPKFIEFSSYHGTHPYIQQENHIVLILIRHQMKQKLFYRKGSFDSRQHFISPKLLF